MTQHAMTDGELISRFATSGRAEAFDELVRRYIAMVLRTCHRVSGNAHEAEDAAQAVFATLAERAADLTGHRSVAGWLYSTAWHVASRARRSAVRRERRERVAAARRPIAQTQTIDLDSDEARGELYRAIEMLPPDYRCAIVLHHLQGLPVGEIATILDTAPGTVAARLSRGRALMRERLAARGTTLGSMILAEILEAERQRAVAIGAPSATTPHMRDAATLCALARRVASPAIPACGLAIAAKAAGAARVAGWLDACARWCSLALPGQLLRAGPVLIVVCTSVAAAPVAQRWVRTAGAVFAVAVQGAFQSGEAHATSDTKKQKDDQGGL
jgi:RNA polymerase sigma factor (sigma-70 family)